FAVAVNQDRSLNSESNPAARGSILTLFATGSGATSPPTLTGRLPRGAAPAATAAVTIGGRPAEIFYQGEIAAGVLPLNVKVPDSAAAGGQPAVLSVGGAASPGATVYLK